MAKAGVGTTPNVKVHTQQNMRGQCGGHRDDSADENICCVEIPAPTKQLACPHLPLQWAETGGSLEFIDLGITPGSMKYPVSRE